MPNFDKNSVEKKESFLSKLNLRNRRESLIKSEEFKYKKNLTSLVNRTKRWKDLANKDKLILMFHYIIDENYLSISLNISHELIEKIKDLLPKEQIDYLRRRMNLNIKNKLGYIPKGVWLVAHEKNRKLHLHGVIQVKPEERKQLKEILKRTMFGKGYKGLNINKYIIKDTWVYAPKNWLRYMTKDNQNTKKKVFDSLYICRELTKEVKAIYEKRILQR